jgi:hypothetical protein
MIRFDRDLLAKIDAAAVVDQAWFRPALQGHGGTKCRRHTLMSRFKGVKHEFSSPDRLGSEVVDQRPRMAGGGAEDDGRSNSDARVGYRRTLFRLGAASV